MFLLSKKVNIFGAILALKIIFCTAANVVPGRFLQEIQAKSSLVSRAIPSARAAECQNGFELVCDGCYNLGICAGEDEPVITLPCSQLSPGSPFCSKGSCSPTPPSGVVECQISFRCSAQGYFPYPDSCSKYYICSAENGGAKEYICDNNYVYDPIQKGCKRRITFSDCSIFDCSNTENGFIVFPAAKRFYAFCFNENGVKETIVYRCFDPNAEFNLQTLSCEFKCPAEGRYPNEIDCHSFYECTRSSLNILTARLSDCPNGGFFYDVVTKTCMAGFC